MARLFEKQKKGTLEWRCLGYSDESKPVVAQVWWIQIVATVQRKCGFWRGFISNALPNPCPSGAIQTTS